MQYHDIMMQCWCIVTKFSYSIAVLMSSAEVYIIILFHCSVLFFVPRQI